MDIQINGELGEFIKVMRVLQDFPEVQSINIIQGSLKEFSSLKRFVYLSDGVTERKYVIAELTLFLGKTVSMLEVEREDKAISTLICFNISFENKLQIYHKILDGVINNNGTWDKEQIRLSGIESLSLRHGKSNIRHRANLISLKIN